MDHLGRRPGALYAFFEYRDGVAAREARLAIATNALLERTRPAHCAAYAIADALDRSGDAPDDAALEDLAEDYRAGIDAWQACLLKRTCQAGTARRDLCHLGIIVADPATIVDPPQEAAALRSRLLREASRLAGAFCPRGEVAMIATIGWLHLPVEWAPTSRVRICD